MILKSESHGESDHMSLTEKVQEKQDEFIAWRRHIHSNPELAFQEFKTTEFIKQKLESWGIETRPNGDKTGVIGTLKGGLPGTKTIALRCDIDALPVTENTGLDFASKNKGVCHACGHDIHTATLLGTAYMLSQYRDRLAGTVRFIFQPAEERLGGSRSMIENGALDGVDCILGAHTWPPVPGGSIGVRKGAMMAASDSFKITVTGRGGHGAHPEQCIDPVVTGAYIITALQTIVSRRVAPLDSAVITVGHLTAGTASNVIPNDCVLEGTVRSQDPETRKKLADWIANIAQHTAAGMYAEAKVEYKFGVPPTVSTDSLVDTISAAVAELLGPDHLVELAQPSMGSEDFAYYLEKVPGAFFRLGTGDERPASHGSLHNSTTLFSEKAIAAGVVTFVGTVFKLTGSDMSALK
jgi:amidohydrolase